MADVKIDFGFDELNKAKQLLDEMRKAAKDIRAAMKQTGGAVEKDLSNAKELAKSTKKVASEKKKLTAIEAEELRQKRALEKVEAQLALANSKTNRTLIEKKKQLLAVNRELRTGSKNTASWGKALGSFQFKFNALGNIAANVVQQMSRKFAQFVKGSLEAYDKQIKAERALLTAMEGRGAATDRLIRQAAQLQKITLFGDEETIRAQSLIAAFVQEEKQIAKIIPLVQDLAQAKGMDLAGAADLVGKTLGSTTNALSRYGIEVSGTVGSTERLDSLARGLSDAFGGQAEAAALVDAQFTQLKNTIGDLQEKIGEYMNDAIFMFRVQNNLWPKLNENINQVSEAEIKANEKFKELKNNITDSKSASEALIKLQEESKILKDEYKEAVTVAANAKRKEFTAANEVVKSKREEKEVYKELIPLLEVYIGEIQDKEIKAKTEATKVSEKRNAELEKERKEVELLIESLKTFNEDDVSLEPWMTAEGMDAASDLYKQKESDYQDHLDRLREKADEQRTDEFTEQEKHEKMIESLKQRSFQVSADLVASLTSLTQAQKAKELSAVGDNAKKREQIEREYAKKEKNLALVSAIMSTAQGVARSFADYPFPYALIPAAIVAAAGAVQISTIANQQFAEGGPIKGEPHSRGGVNVEAEGGEYIINKRATSKYKSLIEAINQDDQVRIMDAMARDRKIEIKRGTDPYTRKLYELMAKQERYGEDNEFYIKHKGNVTLKIRKN